MISGAALPPVLGPPVEDRPTAAGYAAGVWIMALSESRFKNRGFFQASRLEAWAPSQVIHGGPAPLFRVTPCDAPDLRVAAASLAEAMAPIQVLPGAVLEDRGPVPLPAGRFPAQRDRHHHELRWGSCLGAESGLSEHCPIQ